MPRTRRSNPYGTLGPSPSRVRRITPRTVTSPNPVRPPAQAGPVRPAGPTDAEIMARVNAIYNPMQADVLRAMQEASRQSQARLAAIGGLGGAWTGILRTIAPNASMGYYGAATAAPQFAGAAGGEMAGRISADQAASQAFTQKVAPAAPGAPAVDAQAAGGVLTGLQGTIPSELYRATGDAAKKEAEGNIAAAAAQTQYDITEEVLKAAGVDQQYVAQLIELAEKRPELYFQVVDEIRRVAASEEASAFEREKFEFDRTQANRAYQLDLRDAKRQDAAFRLQQRELGYDIQSDKQQMAYKYASLNLQSQKAVAAAKAAEAKGRQIDAAASKVRGFVVDKQGRFVMDNGKRIPVAKEPNTARGKAVQNRTKAVGKARSTAFTFGKTLIKDTAIKTPDFAPPGAKAYVKRRGKNGTIFETTDDPAKALKSISFAEAMEQAWGAVDGDTLVRVYGMSPAQVRKQIRQALIRAGWRPDGQRP